MRLSVEDFGAVIRNSPLVSIDYRMRNPDGLYLLGQRVNAPAQGYWFNLGGRIFKNEPIAAAQKRVFEAETGRSFDGLSPDFIGVFDHIYPDNVFHAPDYGTHYVCLTYALDVGFTDLPRTQDQHDTYRWMSATDILTSEEVHENTKIAFRDLPLS